MPSKKQPLKQNDHILGKIKKFMNRKGVIQKVVAEGTISKYHVLFEGDSKPQEVTSRAIQCDPAFLPHSPQQVKQAFIAAGGGEAGLEAAVSLGAVIQLAPPVQLPPTCPPLEVLMSPASNFDEEGEQGNTQGAVQDTSIDDGDESGTEDQPMFDDIPDASMQQLLGTGTTIPEDDATNPLIAHGLKWTLEECISMDVCRDQPKNTVINFPNGVVPDFGNFYSIWKLLFPYDIMPDCVQNTSLLLEKGGLPPTASTEMEKWFGIIFARTLFKEQGRDLWRTEMHVESCCLPAAFGTRFGMSRNRQCIQFCSHSSSLETARGDHVALSANVQGHQLFAVGWLDGKRKDLVSTCGTTLPSTPATRTRQEVVVSADKGVSTRPYLRTTPRCNIVDSYFDNFHFIDVHDHMRQGILKLEQHWLTRNWVYRVLSTLFGVIVTDCYYASRYIHPAEMSGVDFREYVDRLTYQLIMISMVLGQVLILMNRNRFMLEMVKPFTPSNPCTLCQHMVRRKENVQSQHQYASIVQDDAALSVAKRQHFSVPPVMSVLVVQSWLFAVPAQGVIA
eukprot:Em0022g712a